MSAATRLAALLALAASWARIQVGALNPSKDRYAHVSYRFAQHPGGIHGFGFGSRTSSLAEEGTGEIWLSWEPVNHVRLRVQGVSESKGIGKILETVYLDSVSKVMYARVEIPKHNLNQCTKFQFPSIQDPFNQQRLIELRDRRNELSNWADHRKHMKDEIWDHRLRVSRLQWSPKKELGLVVTNEGPGEGDLLGLQLEEGDDVLKKIHFHHAPDTAPTIPEDKQFLFEHPSDCLWPDEGGTPPEAPVVDLRPPHERSSTIMDMMLMLASDLPVQEWTEQYLMLTSMLLPADIAVGVEEQSSQPESLPQMSQESYTHASYTFELRRANSRRTGVGDLWMSWEAEPLVRLRGVANSTKFGQGVITIVLDSRSKAMYASVDLKELRLSQCVKYPFPDITTNHNQLRLITLKKRKSKFNEWSLADSRQGGKKAAEIKWTNRYKLALQAQDGTNQITGIQLKEGDRIVKKVDFNLPLDHDKTIPEAAQSLFQPPADCKSADQITHEMATVDLRGPHQRSSVLNDLMLLFASENPKSDWSEEFLLMSSLLLPGDISVMLEDPDPPDIERLHHIAFDYSAITASHGGHVSRSQGSMWINMENRAFRLAGNAKKTKVGDLRIDLLVHADLDQPKIYANVQLEDEGEQQCVVYDYPTLTDDPRHDLEEAASKQLQFYSISEIDGEDCAIFVGQLPRDRSIHIWVDMESLNPNAFLRSEIHHGDKVLRSTNVERWRTGEEVLVEVQPKPEWNCREHDLSGRLANLDIRSMHKKSIQLEDTLFALHELGQDFAVREILGLTGDVAIIVKVPQPPDLSVMQQATMGFRVVADSGHGSGGEMRGNFAVDKPNGRLRIAAEAEGPSGWRITLAIDDLKALAVQLERNDGSQRRCLKVDLKGQPGMLSDGPRIGTGLFEGVETVRGGSNECNHFSFNAAGADSRSLDLWYSEESKQVCQIDLLTAGGRSGTSQLVRIEANTFIDGYMPEVEDFAGFTGHPEDWQCDSSTDSPWVRLRADSAEMLVRSDIQEASTVGRVSEALGMLGLLPSQALAVLLSAEIAPPLDAPPPDSADQAAPSNQRTFEDVTLAPKSPGPDCCKTKGLQAHPEGLAWPIVERYDGEYSCVGGDILSEEQWIEKLSQRIHVPGDHAVGLCLLEGYFEREILAGATMHPQWVNDDILSPILKQFTFTFESTFPLGGYPEGKVANGQKFTGETYRKRHRGEGEVRVDLEKRRLYLMSRTQEFSQGIQSLTSEIIYRGDLDQLWARTRFTGRLEYVQCWQIDTAKALPPPVGQGSANPFTRGKLSGKGFPVPGSDADELAQRYSFFPAQTKRVDLFVNDKHEPAYIKVEDLSRDIAVGVLTRDWHTAPIEDRWFEVGEDWECNPELSDQYLEQLASWDLLQIFLPA